MSHDDFSRIDHLISRSVLLSIASRRYFDRQYELGDRHGHIPSDDELFNARSGAWSALSGDARFVDLLTSSENGCRPWTTREAIDRELAAIRAEAIAEIASWSN